jgi:hypothetical protein
MPEKNTVAEPVEGCSAGKGAEQGSDTSAAGFDKLVLSFSEKL